MVRLRGVRPVRHLHRRKFFPASGCRREARERVSGIRPGIRHPPFGGGGDRHLRRPRRAQGGAHRNHTHHGLRHVDHRDRAQLRRDRHRSAPDSARGPRTAGIFRGRGDRQRRRFPGRTCAPRPQRVVFGLAAGKHGHVEYPGRAGGVQHHGVDARKPRSFDGDGDCRFSSDSPSSRSAFISGARSKRRRRFAKSAPHTVRRRNR